MKFYFGGEPSRVPDGWCWAPTPFRNEGRGSTNLRTSVCTYREFDTVIDGQVSQQIADLHTVMVAAYTADQWVPRSLEAAPDGWTRTMELSVPVVDLKTWEQPDVHRTLTDLLEFVTSDRWKVTFRGGHSRVWAEPLPRSTPRVKRVSLYSGGLDSYSFARATAREEPCLLVTHLMPPGLHRLYDELAPTLDPHLMVSFQVQVNRRTKAVANESTQRTRGLLFMTAGLLMCSSHAVAELTVPENGLLAVNPPLTASRPGACMTKSVHPMTLHLLNTLLHHLGTEHRVINPYALLTKGEVCRDAIARGDATLADLAGTITCSHPESRRGQFANCGHCYPCLVRHASLRAVGGDLTAYRDVDPAERVDPSGQHHRRAVIDWLSSDADHWDLVAGSPFPPGTDIAAMERMIRRSRAELAAALL